jgi:hypothetical protein
MFPRRKTLGNIERPAQSRLICINRVNNSDNFVALSLQSKKRLGTIAEELRCYHLHHTLHFGVWTAGIHIAARCVKLSLPRFTWKKSL